MTAHITRGDSGTQPSPHHCTVRPREDGTAEGCPNWPLCVFSTACQADTAERRERAESRQTVSRDLAALAGWAAGAVLFLGVAVLLLPLFA